MFRRVLFLWPIVIETLSSYHFYRGRTVDLFAIGIREYVPWSGFILIFEVLLEPVNRTFESIFHGLLSYCKTLRGLTDWVILGVSYVNLDVLPSLQSCLKILGYYCSTCFNNLWKGEKGDGVTLNLCLEIFTTTYCFELWESEHLERGIQDTLLYR